jgi:hypothetical protein
LSHTENENQFDVTFDFDLSEKNVSNEELRFIESNIGDLVKRFLIKIEEE